jgi:hypothetical protein
MGKVVEYETIVIENHFKDMVDFVHNKTEELASVDSGNRFAYVIFAGQFINPIAPTLPPQYKLIYSEVNFTSNLTTFFSALDVFTEAPLGTTQTGLEIDYVREHILTPETARADAERIVILVTDSGPTSVYGDKYIDAEFHEAEHAVSRIQAEDDVTFVLVRAGIDPTAINPTYAYESDGVKNWMFSVADRIYNTTFATMKEDLATGFPFS